MKITDSSPETQGASMQSFHPPLFKQQTKGRDATRQQSSGRSVLFPLSAHCFKQ